MGIWVCDKDSISYEPYFQYKIISNIILAQNILTIMQWLDSRIFVH